MQCTGSGSEVHRSGTRAELADSTHSLDRTSETSSVWSALVRMKWTGYLLGVLTFIGLFLGLEQVVMAQEISDSAIDLAEEVRDMPVSSTVRLLFILTALTFVPAMILAMTPFTRFVIVFSMMRQAIGVQQAPPNQVLIGLSLFLSLIIMQNPLGQVYDEAITPFMQGELEVMDAAETAMVPMRDFMLLNTRRSDLQTMLSVSKIENVETLEDIPSSVVVTSFMLSELKTAFIIGVKIYLPFLVLDIIIANILLGMGMMVLPPIIISLPFKIMLFVLMDGWSLLITSMTASYYGI